MCSRSGPKSCPSIAKGALIIDCSTIDVESAKQAHALAAKHGMRSIDAPVSGGTGGAKGATLTFMCGGEDKAFAAAKPMLENMGKKIVHCGGAGAGQAAKICNNMILGVSMIGGQRGLCAGREAGPVASGAVRRRLDLVGPMLVADILLPGARSGADIAGQQRLQAGFCPALMVKDLTLAQEAAKAAGAATPLGKHAEEIYKAFDTAGHGGVDFSGIISMFGVWRQSDGLAMTTFQEARAFLLKHRTDYDKAVEGFRWPDPVPFNWALDWFDAELARNPDSKDRAALWIVDAGSNREIKPPSKPCRAAPTRWRISCAPRD